MPINGRPAGRIEIREQGCMKFEQGENEVCVPGKEVEVSPFYRYEGYDLIVYFVRTYHVEDDSTEVPYSSRFVRMETVASDAADQVCFALKIENE